VFAGVLRSLCYLAFGFLLAGLGTLAFIDASGMCTQLGASAVACLTPLFDRVAQFSVAVVLLSVFTGLPALLALFGLFFLMREILRRRA
jgi:hypothetical protein